MGDKRVSIRTLPTGEKVKHHPPTDTHPEGRMVLIMETSPLKERLTAALADNQAAQKQLKERAAARLKAKQDRLDAHPKVPYEKRCC